MHLEKAIIGGSGRNNTGDYKRVMAKTRRFAIYATRLSHSTPKYMSTCIPTQVRSYFIVTVLAAKRVPLIRKMKHIRSLHSKGDCTVDRFFPFFATHFFSPLQIDIFVQQLFQYYPFYLSFKYCQAGICRASVEYEYNFTYSIEIASSILGSVNDRSKLFYHACI